MGKESPAERQDARGTETVLVKIGGRPAEVETLLEEMAREMAALRGSYRFILVHGGGAEVSRVSKVFGLAPVFRDGVRLTSPEEMGIVDMVLSGKMNKYMVRVCGRHLPTVGLSGSDGRLFVGRRIGCEEGSVTCTGEIAAVDPALLELLLVHGYTPVISSTSMDEAGAPLNINADEAAWSVASALPADHLVFLSDVPGILKEEKVIEELTEAGIGREIAAGVISGGMIPKVRSSVKALAMGVKEVIIGSYAAPGDLSHMLQGRRGTRIITTEE